MSDEWRLTAELDGDPATIERLVGDVTRHLPGSGRLTRDARIVRVYSESEADAARAEALVLRLLEKTPLGYELWHDRWDDEEGDWEEIAPDLPPGEEPLELGEPDVPEPPVEVEEPIVASEKLADFPGAATSLRDAGALVLVTFAGREDASGLRAQLAEAGIQTVARRRGVGIPATDESTAAELAAHLRSYLPPDARVETTRVPGRRPRE